jgi:hypothetical protein
LGIICDFLFVAEKIMQENETEEIRTKALYLLDCRLFYGKFYVIGRKDKKKKKKKIEALEV